MTGTDGTKLHMPRKGAAVGFSLGVRWRDIALIAYGRGFEHPTKIRFIRWLARRLTAGRVIVRYAPGATIAIDPSDYIGWTVFTRGSYEPASLGLALRIMAQQPGLFVDVGANFGWYTCAIAAQPDCTVVSIEPDCENCASLRRNIEHNHQRNVVVFNGAAGPQFDAVQTVRRNWANAGTVAIRQLNEKAGPHGDWVATVPLDTLLKRVVCPPERPVLLKIDVEGFEPEVLAGLDFEGPFRPRNILMEFDRQLSVRGWQSLENVKAFFAKRRYELLDVFGEPLGAPTSVPEENIWARDMAAGAIVS